MSNVMIIGGLWFWLFLAVTPLSTEAKEALREIAEDEKRPDLDAEGIPWWNFWRRAAEWWRYNVEGQG